MEIKLPATAESIALAREAVVSHADRLGMAPSELGDLRTVVSEAFTNAVHHAYEDDVEGKVAIAVRVRERVFCLTVRDFGAGIVPRPERDVPSLSMGLPIIGALSEEFRLTTRRGHGTELEICIPMGSDS
jgi:stage II sporulation protein AB (anti-sigma F factor)